MLLVFVLTTEETPSKLLVRTPVAALNVNNEDEMPGILVTCPKR